MTHEFRLADIGEGLEEAEIIEWRVAIGDWVARDQPIVEVLTDKSNAELPAPVEGRIVSLSGAVGDIVEVGELIAVIDGDTADAPAPTESNDGQTAEVIETAASAPDRPRPAGGIQTFQHAARPRPVAVAPEPVIERTRRPKASPTTRLEAARRGIDLATIDGTGPGGRILLTDLDPRTPATASPDPEGPAAQDVGRSPSPPQPPSVVAQRATTAPPPVTEPSPAPAATSSDPPTAPDATFAARIEPLRGIRRVIAQNMTQSWTEIPHIHAFAHIDAEPLLDLRRQLRASGRAEFDGLTPLAFFAAAVARSVRAHPQANASLHFAKGEIAHHEHINIGLAVAAPQGLVVPVLRQAETLGFAGMAAQVRALVDHARRGAVDASDFRDGTVTITNFGSLGGEQALPLIRPPESIIFGFGSIDTRPFVVDEAVVARKTMHLVLGADHRLLDGDITTALLNHVAADLANPINLILGD
ncbi:MAG: dihydrolipoamide acetyltransferase family protein [Actinomycetota bacterium]